MEMLRITGQESGQRLDKYLRRRFPGAPFSFLHRMLRRKNITLNGRRADGSELISAGDELRLFLSEETISSMRAGKAQPAGVFSGKESAGASGNASAAGASGERISRPPAFGIIYEDSDILIADKPAGLLTQKASAGDRSLNDELVRYLLDTGKAAPESFHYYRPSAVNRLDRNTSGIVLCALTLRGAQFLSEMIRSRQVRKYYRMVVLGAVHKPGEITGGLIKDSRTNTVAFADREDAGMASRTVYRPVRTGKRYTLIEAELVTGRTHQLRVHMASAGHPILGDPKYGDLKENRRLKDRFGIRHQLLCAARLVFPETEGEFARLSGREFNAQLPEVFRKVMEAEQGEF